MTSTQQLNQAKLYRCLLSSISVTGALRAAATLTPAPVRAFTLIYTVDSCRFVQWDGTSLRPLPGAPVVDEDSLFELRSFCSDWQLHWVRCGNSGSAIIIADSSQTFPAAAESRDIFAADISYLLWGTPTSKANELFEHRIGTLQLPPFQPQRRDRRVQLNGREYFIQDMYGNKQFLTERLTGLE